MNIFNLSEYTDSPLFNQFSKLIDKQFYTTKWEETISSNDQSRLRFYKQVNPIQVRGGPIRPPLMVFCS